MPNTEISDLCRESILIAPTPVNHSRNIFIRNNHTTIGIEMETNLLYKYQTIIRSPDFVKLTKTTPLSLLYIAIYLALVPYPC